MKLIPSFEKDHDLMQKGLYFCGERHGVSTWDLRFKKPNCGDYIEQKALHTIEHLCATILRNGEHADDIIYFGPMGCRTGFYLLTTNLSGEEVKAMLKDCFKRAADMSEIPGAKRRECGNFEEHDLEGAKRECAAYLGVLNEL